MRVGLFFYFINQQTSNKILFLVTIGNLSFGSSLLFHKSLCSLIPIDDARRSFVDEKYDL